MLWLAGLIGLMAAGTAGLLGVMDPGEEDTPPDDPDTLTPASAHTGASDLLDLVGEQAGDTVIGTAEAETLTGGPGADEIGAYDGDDTIAGGEGDDQIFGGDGLDRLDGDSGDDHLFGEDGTDRLDGGDGNDTAFGGNGADTIDGAEGADSLQGSAGTDLVRGGAGADAVHGGLDNDQLEGGRGEDTLFGGWGDDHLDGRVLDAEGRDIDEGDFLNGGGGADTITIGSGDIVTAGAGTDTLLLGDWLVPGQEVELIDFDPGEDRLVLIWDDAGGETTAEVELRPANSQIGETGAGTAQDLTQVRLNGEVVALVRGGAALSEATVSLVTPEQAQAFGFLNR